MTPDPKTYNYSDRDLAEAMRQKGGVQCRRIERKALQNAACNRSAKRTTAGDINPRYQETRFAAIGLD